MTPEARQQAAQHFWQHLDSGQLIAELPKAQRPQNEAEGHAFKQHLQNTPLSRLQVGRLPPPAKLARSI